MSRRSIKFVVLSLSILIYPLFQPARADNIQQFGHQIPTRDQFIDALTPKKRQQGTSIIKTRGIRPLKPQSEELPESVGAGLELNFAFNSDQLTTKTKSVLDNLAEALSDDALKYASFLVEGHTDGVGIPSYNLELSLRRANSVKRYLVKKFNIPAEKLTAIGKGEADLFYPSNPKASANRRVQIINEGKRNLH